jgi:hypothetical protein
VTRFPANRALAPSPELAAARWVSEDVLISGLPATTDDAWYRAMDWLLEIKDALEKEVFGRVADLPSLEVDLLFFDTTSTYFELDGEDEPVPRDSRGSGRVRLVVPNTCPSLMPRCTGLQVVIDEFP